MLKPGLYIVGTPIGNLEDITYRAVAILKEVQAIAAEDTRETHKLLGRYGIAAPMLSCHKFNEASRVQEIVERIRRGESVALVTDSGMPGVSDPGARMVAACRAAGLYVTVVPGASAVTAAVAVSGFGGHGFLFEGFLSHKSAARRKRLSDLLKNDCPIVLFESPYRLRKLLEELKDLAPERELFIGREITKHFEELLWGKPSELMEKFSGRAVRGELVVVIAPP